MKKFLRIIPGMFLLMVSSSSWARGDVSLAQQKVRGFFGATEFEGFTPQQEKCSLSLTSESQPISVMSVGIEVQQKPWTPSFQQIKASIFVNAATRIQALETGTTSLRLVTVGQETDEFGSEIKVRRELVVNRTAEEGVLDAQITLRKYEDWVWWNTERVRCLVSPKRAPLTP